MVQRRSEHSEHSAERLTTFQQRIDYMASANGERVLVRISADGKDNYIGRKNCRNRGLIVVVNECY